ncbi:hypothetical protein BDI4_60037 [Burkholderia diffusa]|nr:hypothetical protein BDI4_60037 [Burkholderia diffusa]
MRKECLIHIVLLLLHARRARFMSVRPDPCCAVRRPDPPARYKRKPPGTQCAGGLLSDQRRKSYSLP